MTGYTIGRILMGAVSFNYDGQHRDPVTEDTRQGRQFRVSADRTSASRKVRYVEGSKPAAGNCRVCEIGN